MVLACHFNELRSDLVSNGELLQVIEHGNAQKCCIQERGEEREVREIQCPGVGYDIQGLTATESGKETGSGSGDVWLGGKWLGRGLKEAWDVSLFLEKIAIPPKRQICGKR